MIRALNKTFYKNGYLLIIAAWLYTFSFIFANYWLYTSSPSRVKVKLEDYLKKSEQRFENFAKDEAMLTAAVTKGTAPKKSPEYFKETVGLFIYTYNNQDEITPSFWNTNIMQPDARDLQKPDGKYLSNYSGSEFEFIKQTVNFQGQQEVAVALIPIYWTYPFENEYLRSEFAAVKNVEDRYRLVTTGADFEIKNGDGKNLFGLKENRKDKNNDPGTWSLLLRILSVVFVLIFLNAYSYEVVEKKGWAKGFGLLAGTLLLLRLLSYRFSFPFNYDNFELFNPFIYASNSLHRSLGDLLINIMLSLWLVSFVKFTASDYLKKLEDIKGQKGWWVTLGVSFFLIVISFISAGVIKSLITDSQISFNVTDFFSLDIYTLVSFFILCLIVLTFFYFSHLALLLVDRCVDVPLFVKYLFIAFGGLLYLSFNIDNPASAGNVLVLLWLLVYLIIMEYRKEDLFIPILKSSFFIIWIIFFASSISALIIYQNRAKSMDQRIKTAENISRNEDAQAESLMNTGINDIDSAFLSANFDRLHYQPSNKRIKDSLINFYFSGYMNKYETRLYTYDSVSPLYNDDTTSFYTIYNVMLNRGHKTDNPDMVYYGNDLNAFNYLYHKEIKDSSGSTKGYFFIVSEPKKYKSQAVFPELFKKGKSDVSDLDLTYAIYNKGELVTSFGDYNFSSHLPRYQLLKQEYKEEKTDGYAELWYNGGNNKLVILVTKGSLLFEAITLFAYLFVSFLFVIIMLQAVVFIIRNKFRLRLLKQEFSVTLRNQVQGAIIFISIFSFVVIGISTISFYISRFSQTNRERLVKAIKILGNEIETREAAHSFDPTGTADEPVTGSKPEGTLEKITTIHNVDANLYDLNGRLIVSTQPYIYNKQIFSRLMEPMAYNRLHYKNEIQVIQKESVSHFSFLNIYVPVKDPAGRTYAYLNIPYLNTQKELNQEISNFLVTLINLNAFIFVIAGAIAVLLTNRITNSFTLIAGKMKDIHLGKGNEEIAWNTNDEIGGLVNEYNKMVKKLEDSAQALAKSEREGAWREMARQVAHEIKNPLTPMKLSIQYLQRAIQEKSPNIQELSQKVSATLVEQIDQLAKIASDFSQFANISHVKTEVFDVNEILSSLINLYGTNERLQISWHRLQQPAFISADRTQMNRLFTNLFQNAIEASDGAPVIPISVQQEVKSGELVISITDRGSGIPVEKQEKIFTPNFTTKTSGTGLGLAICKGIAEKANGHIWFVTAAGEGTTFYIALPLEARN